MLSIKPSHQKQQDNKPNAAPAPAQQLPSELAAGKAPAPLVWLLQQLGISSSAAIWAATQGLAELKYLQSPVQIEAHISNDIRRLLNMQNHSKAFLLNGTPPTLSQQLLQELQQQSKLYMLLPSALLQCVVDMPVSSHTYTFCCMQTAGMARELSGHYHIVLQEGPASLGQHMTGQRQPQAEGGPSRAQPAAAQCDLYVCLPADVHTCQLQLLGQLVPKLLQLWATAIGLEPGAKPDGGSDTPMSTGGHGGSGQHANNSPLVDGTSGSRGTSCDHLVWLMLSQLLAA
jgi:hypothetical protein